MSRRIEFVHPRVRHSVVDGRVKEYGKTARSRRDVPLTARSVAAVDALTPRLQTPLLLPAARGGYIDLANWRRREWRPALEAAGLDPELTPYAMRHTYASFALDAGVTIFELARLMGTSVKVIDDTYGHLVHGSLDRVRAALDQRPVARPEPRRRRQPTPESRGWLAGPVKGPRPCRDCFAALLLPGRRGTRRDQNEETRLSRSSNRRERRDSNPRPPA